MKKAMRVDICSRRPGMTGAGVLRAVMKNPWRCGLLTECRTTSLHIRQRTATSKGFHDWRM
jgi:hypothetical protein